MQIIVLVATAALAALCAAALVVRRASTIDTNSTLAPRILPAASAVRVLKDNEELTKALERAAETERHLAALASQRYSRHQSRSARQYLA